MRVPIIWGSCKVEKGPHMHMACYADNEKCGRDTIAKMLAHYERWGCDPEKAAVRKWIDPKKIGRNWNLAPARAEGIEGYCRRLIERYVSLGAKLTASSAPMCDWLVTAPEGLPDDLVAEFFKVSYDELVKHVGSEDYVVCAYVHMDEPKARPHMHFCFVQPSMKAKMTNDKSRPLRYTKKDEQRNKAHKKGEVKRDKKGTVRYEQVPVIGPDGKPEVRWSLSPSAIWTRTKLQNFHKVMDAAVAKRLGLGKSCGLILQEGDMDKQLSHLPHDEYVQVTQARDKARAEAQKAEACAEQAQQRAEAAELAEERASVRAEAAQRAEEKAQAGLESVRQAEQAGPAELARAAADRGAEQAERDAAAENRRLEREYEQARIRNAEARSRHEAAAAANAEAHGRRRRVESALAGALDRCNELVAQILAALPHLARRFAEVIDALVVHVPGLERLDAEAERAAIEYTGVVPVPPDIAPEAYAAAAAGRDDCSSLGYVFEIDDECRLRGREAGDSAGVDCRTGQTDEQAAERARSRVAAKRGQRERLLPRHADLSAPEPQTGEAAHPAWTAARAAECCASDVEGWRAALAALGFAATPTSRAHVWAVADAAGEAAPAIYQDGFGAAGRPADQGRGPFAKHAHAKTPADAAKLLRLRAAKLEANGAQRAEAIAETCGLASRAAEFDYPEDAEWAKAGAVVEFGKEMGLWDYGKPQAAQERRREATAAKRSKAMQPLVDKGSDVLQLPTYKRLLTPEQRRQWSDARCRTSHGSTSAGSSSDAPSRSYSEPQQSRGRSR